MGSSSSKLAPETAGKLQASTHFDKKEISQLYTSFVKECPSGRMGRDDLLKIYRQFFPFGNAAPFVDRLISTLSSSSSSSSSSSCEGETSNTSAAAIEFSDYIIGLSVISRGRLDEKLAWAFKFCDCDGDGWISLKDLVESIQLSQKLMGKMFTLTCDVPNHQENDDATAVASPTNSYLDDPEFRAKSLFCSMDSDVDGRASLEDFKGAVLNDSEIIQAFLVYDGVI